MSIFSGERGREGAMWAAGQLWQGQDTANQAIDEGYARARREYGQATDLFGSLADSYGEGSRLYQDALGVNGEAGTGRAQSAYASSPGYTFNLDQGLQALQRTHAASGTLASGNADADSMKFASGLASQDYGAWIDRLSGLDAKRAGAVTGEASSYGDLGRLAYGAGATKAGIASDTSRNIATVGMEGFKAGDQADAMQFGALMGGANLLASGLGAVAGNPAILSNIGSGIKSLGSGVSSAYSAIFG